MFKWSVSSGSYSVVHPSLFRIFHLNSAKVYANSILCQCVSFTLKWNKRNAVLVSPDRMLKLKENGFPFLVALSSAVLCLSPVWHNPFFLPFLWRLSLSHCEWEPLRDSRFCNGSSSVPARLSFIFNFLPICGARTNNETADGKRRRLLSTFPIKFGHLKWDFILFFSTAGCTGWNICLVTHIGSLVQPKLFKVYLFCLKGGWLFSYQSCRNADDTKGHQRRKSLFSSIQAKHSQWKSSLLGYFPHAWPRSISSILLFFSPFASQLSDLLLYHPPQFSPDCLLV